MLLPIIIEQSSYVAPEFPREEQVSRASERQFPACKDRTVNVIAKAGWKGEDIRIAFAIAQRESNGNQFAEGGGAYGLFQLQASVWASSKFWPTNPFNAEQNAAAAHAIWRELSWRPWGISANGSGMDVRDYSSWSSATQYAWILEPYLRYRNAFPQSCEWMLRDE